MRLDLSQPLKPPDLLANQSRKPESFLAFGERMLIERQAIPLVRRANDIRLKNLGNLP